MKANRPNILYLHCHDAGRYIAPYGQAAHTPNLASLARQGVLFRQAFCAAPTCSASRAALLTGQASHSAGMLGLAHRPFCWTLRDYSQHLVHTLNAAGYTTALCGVQHETPAPSEEVVREALGYRDVLPLSLLPGESWKDPAAGDRARARSAAEWLHGAARGGEPFFLSCGFVLPHRPYLPAEPSAFPEEDERFVRVPPTVPDEPRTRRDMAEYLASVRVMDECSGAVLRALDEAGLAERTLVIATTDHAIAFPGMKCNLTDHGLGVYLIVRGPRGAATGPAGEFQGGRVIDGMVSHIDLFPTLCELLEIAPPPWLQGRSVLPLVRGEAEQIHDAVYGEVTYHAAYEPQRCIRTPRWKYIRRFDATWTRPVLPNCDQGLSKEVWLESGWAGRAVAAEQLYDLVFDPQERDNLAGDPRHAVVREEMAGRLAAWMKATGDPLLNGEVPLAEGCLTWPIEIVHIQDGGEPGRNLRRKA